MAKEKTTNKKGTDKKNNKEEVKNTNKTKKTSKKVENKSKDVKKVDKKAEIKDVKKVDKKSKKNKKDDKKDIKVNKEDIKLSTDDKNEFTRLLKIILIVTAIFVVFYAVTLIVTNMSEAAKDDTEEAESEEVEIQYKNIVIGEMLNYGGSYYVLIEEPDEVRTDEYDALILATGGNEDAPTIYRANLTDSFNKIYLGKEENYYVDDMSKFKVKGTTMVKVVDGKIDAVFDNYEAIKNKLNELI